MNDRHFYESAIPETYTILGQSLRPLSLGHLLILNRIGSPFVTDNAAITSGDLALAVAICTETYEGALAMLRDPGFERIMDRWGRKLSKQNVPLNDKAQLFLEYLKDGLSVPDYMYDLEKSFPVEAPVEQVTKVILMSKLGFTEREVLDRPWRLCQWDYLTLRAVEGQITFQDMDGLEQLARDLGPTFERMKNGKGSVNGA